MKFIDNLGAKLWMKTAGDGPPVIYLHGGPGYCSYSFENFAGPQLEKSLRMIYFDQRDCGRSNDISLGAPMGIEALVSDVEAVRKASGFSEVGLLGHSFGGVLALEYLKLYPERVNGVILLESIPDLAAVISYQTSKLLELSSKYPELSQPENSNSPLEKLLNLQSRLDWFDLQKEMYWKQTEALIKNTAMDIESRLMDRQQSRQLPALAASGYLESEHEELQDPIPVKSAIFAGRHSHCMGEENLERIGRKLNTEIVWFENSGHMPQIEEPDIFAHRVREFFRPA